MLNRLNPARFLKLQSAHNASVYADKPFRWFVREVGLLRKGKNSEIDFDEEFYLSCHSDVKMAVREGLMECGYIHFCLHGLSEGRRWSSKAVIRKFGLMPNMPNGLFKPERLDTIKRYEPCLQHLPKSSTANLMIFVPRLDDKLFFAGFSSFFNDISSIFCLFESVTVIVKENHFNSSLVAQYGKDMRIIRLNELCNLQYKPSLIYCFDGENFYQALDVFNDLEHTVYYCQDFEPGFYPYGSSYARYEGSLLRSKNLVFSTSFLQDFISKRGLLKTNNIFVTAPKIEPVTVSIEKSKKIFCYFRPEKFNSRNMSDLIIRAVELFCHRHAGYEFYLAGTVDTCYSFSINSSLVYVVSKLPKQIYSKLLGECDAVIALIYSAHPGVIAFQAAASGIPTVTNTFENRDVDSLKAISENLVAFNPATEELVDKLELVLTMPKGNPSFRQELYAGHNNVNFLDFNRALLAQ